MFCRQLGFKEEAAQPCKDATHGEGSGPIWLDHLVCSGNFPPMFLDLPIYCSSFYYTEILNLGIIPVGGIVYGDVFRCLFSYGHFTRNVRFSTNLMASSVIENRLVKAIV